MCDYLSMKRDELIKKLKRMGKEEGKAVRFDKKRGKGSHGILYYGDNRTPVPQGELKTGTLNQILKNLKIDKGAF